MLERQCHCDGGGQQRIVGGAVVIVVVARVVIVDRPGPGHKLRRKSRLPVGSDDRARASRRSRTRAPVRQRDHDVDESHPPTQPHAMTLPDTSPRTMSKRGVGRVRHCRRVVGRGVRATPRRGRAQPRHQAAAVGLDHRGAAPRCAGRRGARALPRGQVDRDPCRRTRAPRFSVHWRRWSSAGSSRRRSGRSCCCRRCYVSWYLERRAHRRPNDALVFDA